MFLLSRKFLARTPTASNGLYTLLETVLSKGQPSPYSLVFFLSSKHIIIVRTYRGDRVVLIPTPKTLDFAGWGCILRWLAIKMHIYAELLNVFWGVCLIVFVFFSQPSKFS